MVGLAPLALMNIRIELACDFYDDRKSALTLNMPGFSESGKAGGGGIRPPPVLRPYLKANDYKLWWCDTTSEALPENNNKTFDDVITMTLL